jgi:hypothetical protein
MRRDEALRRLRENRESLAALGVTHAYLFGSVARDAATAESDIDVVVDAEGGKPLGLFRLARVTEGRSPKPGVRETGSSAGSFI